MLFDPKQKMNHISMRHMMILITYTIALLWMIMHVDTVISIIVLSINVLKPFIYGIFLAFVFNIPLSFFMRKLEGKIHKGRKACAALLSLASIVVVIMAIIWIVVPLLADSIKNLIEALPLYIEQIGQWVNMAMEEGWLSEEIMLNIMTYFEQAQTLLLEMLKDGIPQVIGAAGSIISSVTNAVLAIVICVYITISKEKLIRQCDMVAQAFMKEKIYNFSKKVVKLAQETFTNFISGQLLEACIIGVLCYIGCLILHFPYAPILALIIGITNVIPIFGAIFGVGISCVLVMIVNPVQGLLFLVFGICLQQFESNIIYPRVVGNSVGLSGLWVLFAITIGGDLLGLVGMVIGLPLFSIVYTLLKEATYHRLETKKVKEVG